MPRRYLVPLRPPLKSIPETADSQPMDAEFLPNIFGGVVNVVGLCLFIAGVMKVFQMANTLNEIRDALKDLQRNHDAMATVRPVGVPTGVAAGQSGDEMLRALDVQLNLHPTVEVEALKPEIVDPR